MPGKNRWKKEIMCKEADRKMAGSWEQCAGSRSRQTHRKNQLVCLAGGNRGERNVKKKNRESWSGLCRCPGIPSHLMALLRKNGELRKDMAEQNTKRSVEQKIAE